MAQKLEKLKSSRYYGFVLLFAMLLFFYAVFKILTPHNFGSSANLYSYLQSSIIYAVGGCGLYFIVVMGLFDFAVGADLGVIQYEVHEYKSQQRENDIARGAAEKTQIFRKCLFLTACRKNGNGFKYQHQTDRNDHGRYIQLIIEETDQQPDQCAAAKAADDKPGIAEFFREDHTHDR